jgi:hypothetical protein
VPWSRRSCVMVPLILYRRFRGVLPLGARPPPRSGCSIDRSTHLAPAREHEPRTSREDTSDRRRISHSPGLVEGPHTCRAGMHVKISSSAGSPLVVPARERGRYGSICGRFENRCWRIHASTSASISCTASVAIGHGGHEASNFDVVLELPTRSFVQTHGNLI